MPDPLARTENRREPRVSVVIPVYNAARWVRRAVGSVLSQLGVSVEVICVDDGSTDGSGAILDDLAAADARMRVVHQANAGQGAARNRGLGLATGDFVHFMDADDELAGPRVFEGLVAEMARDGLEVLFFDAETRLDPGQSESTRSVRAQDYVRLEDYSGVWTGRELMARMLKDHAFTVSPCLLLSRRSYLAAHGVRFPGEPIYFEDNLFMTRVVLTAVRAGHRPWRFYVRHVHAGTVVTSPATMRHLRGYLACHRDACRLLDEGGWDRGMRAELRRRAADYRRGVRRTVDADPGLAAAAASAMTADEYRAFRAVLRYPLHEKVVNGLRCLREHGLGYTLRRVLLRRRLGEPARAVPSAPVFEVDAAGMTREDLRRRGAELRAALLRGEIVRAAYGPVAWRRLLDVMLMPDAVHYEACVRPGRQPSPYPAPSGIVVSFTSWPGRIGTASRVVANMFAQTRPPDRVVLYLAEEEFPDRRLPGSLEAALRDPRFEVRYTRNVRSHKKHVQVFRDFPRAAVVFVDDDIVYPPTLLEQLADAARLHPYAVVCLRSHTLAMTRRGNFAPYADWMDQPRLVGRPSALVLATTGGGTLVPPGLMPSMAGDAETFMRLAPTADDLWLKWCLLLAGVPCLHIGGPDCPPLVQIEGTQQETLCEENVVRGANDRIWSNLQDAYPAEAAVLRRLLGLDAAARFPGRACGDSRLCRKGRGLMRCLRQNGVRYTLLRALGKVAGLWSGR